MNLEEICEEVIHFKRRWASFDDLKSTLFLDSHRFFILKPLKVSLNIFQCAEIFGNFWKLTHKPQKTLKICPRIKEPANFAYYFVFVVAWRFELIYIPKYAISMYEETKKPKTKYNQLMIRETKITIFFYLFSNENVVLMSAEHNRNRFNIKIFAPWNYSIPFVFLTGKRRRFR